MKKISYPIHLGPIQISSPSTRKKTDHLGRFGGGWQYNVGLMIGNFTRKDGGTIIVNYVTGSRRITIRPAGSRHRDW